MQLRFMQRVSWPMTLFVPVVLALLIAVTAVLSPDVPRAYFIVAFLFAAVALPGILVTLKVLSVPVTSTEVTLLSARKGQQVDVRLPNGAVRTFQNPQLHSGLLTGEFKPGDRFRVLFRDDILFRWQRLDGENA